MSSDSRVALTVEPADCADVVSTLDETLAGRAAHVRLRQDSSVVTCASITVVATFTLGKGTTVLEARTKIGTARFASSL